jgi:cytochrome bd-type quinol oxidase subunit 2
MECGQTDMDAFLLARWQFGITTVYHFIFVPLTLGLAPLVAIALFLILMALILRAVGFEFRGKMPGAGWKRGCDAAIFVGSALPALLWGVALTNIVQGVPIDADKPSP